MAYQRKHKIVGAKLDGQWVKLFYHNARGTVVHSCFIYEKDAKNDCIPEWFGKITR